MKRHILIVEDDPAICEAYKLVLEEEGYVVLTAENGKDAVTKLKQCEALPDLILLDLMMPVMNGWEFLEVRRADPTLAGIPVLALTCGVGAVPPGETNGVVDKPMDLFQLTDLVRAHCREVSYHPQK